MFFQREEDEEEEDEERLYLVPELGRTAAVSGGQLLPQRARASSSTPLIQSRMHKNCWQRGGCFSKKRKSPLGLKLLSKRTSWKNVDKTNPKFIYSFLSLQRKGKTAILTLIFSFLNFLFKIYVAT